MTRRPAVKVLIPFILGILAAKAVPAGIGISHLVSLDTILLMLAALGGNRFSSLPVDLILAASLFLSGVAVTKAEEEGLCEGRLSPEPQTALIEATGFTDSRTRGLVRLEGRPLYVELSGELRLSPRPVRVVRGAGRETPLPGDLIVALGRFALPKQRRNPGGLIEAGCFLW